MDGLFVEPEAFGCSLMCLPSELLSLCLAWLPLRDRISVSHVSQYWRSVSLAHPTIWANIDFSGHYECLRLALSRTGNCPVTITGPYRLDPEHIVSQCLREHLHHIRHIVLDLPEDALPLNLPAPVLVDLASTSYHIDIPVDFLGGRPAQLQILDLTSVSFPLACPAISTVTRLTLDGPALQTHAETYSRLFDLCPRLISLSLHDLDAVFHNSLPRGPAPLSLRTLFLSTEHSRYDLISHFLDWRTDSLRDVHLGQDSIPFENLQRFVVGSTSLQVAVNFERKVTQLAARDAAGRIHAIGFYHVADYAADVAALLLRTKDALSSLVNLEVPLAALHAFIPVCSALPELVRLALRIPIKPRDGRDGGSTHQIPWEQVTGIFRVKALCAESLCEIILHVVCPDARCPPTAHEGTQLANRVLALGKYGGLPRFLVVKGSTGDIVYETVVGCVFEVSFQCP